MKAKAKSGVFITACLSLTAGLIWSYSQFVEYFAENSEDKMRVGVIERELREEKFQRALAESRLRDFSMEVASILPSEKNKQLAANGYEISKLSAGIRGPAAVNLDLSGVVMERAKRLFSEKKFEPAIKEFRRLIDEYPLSPHAVEAHFLMAESAFLTRDFKSCIDQADLMVAQYPDQELTGFILLRLGQINEINSHPDEAAEIYQTVMKNFKNAGLLEQAKRMAKALETK